jgi:hypothetical protein
MKIRNGFVSNSSSSSFIVAFDKRPNSAEEVEQILYSNKREVFYEPAFNDDCININKQDVAKQVFNDLPNISANLELIADTINGGSFDGEPDSDDPKYNNQAYSEKWDEFVDDCQKAAEHEAMKFMKENDNKFIATFEYSDNDGYFFSYMEHGDIFARLPHIRISKH